MNTKRVVKKKPIPTKTKKAVEKQPIEDSDSEDELKSLKKDRQIVDLETFDAKNLIFSKAAKNSKEVFDKKKKRKMEKTYGYRSNISYKYDDETYGSCLLFFDQEALAGYGLGENRDDETDKLTGHSIGLEIYNTDRPTPMERRFKDVILGIHQAACDYLVANADDFQTSANASSVVSMFRQPLYPKNQKKEVDYTKANLKIYPKLKEKGRSRDSEEADQEDETNVDEEPFEVFTKFYSYDDPDQEINYKDVLEKRGYCRPLIGVESIYCGANGTITLQIKLHEASDWRFAPYMMKRLTTSSRSQPYKAVDEPPKLAPTKEQKTPIPTEPRRLTKGKPVLNLEPEDSDSDSDAGEEYSSDGSASE